MGSPNPLDHRQLLGLLERPVRRDGALNFP